MSNTNYDVELNISYDNAHKHYVPTYAVAVPAYYSYTVSDYGVYYASYHTAISFDDEGETELQYYYGAHSPAPSATYNDNPDVKNGYAPGGWSTDPVNITTSGVRSKIYFRNPRRSKVTFNNRNCHIKVNYYAKAEFEIKLNSEGYIASANASFKCSTVEKPIPVQYSWASAKVYYKATTDVAYSYVDGTVSGTWADVTVSTNLSLPTGYEYNIYIEATADDGTTAQTPVGVFSTTDGTSITKCVSPVGTYINGVANFIWSHTTEYGTPQYAYDLQYSSNNGGTWTTVSNHVVTEITNTTASISSAGTYLWRVRTYNSLDQAGAWAQASFINKIPATPPTGVQVTTKGRPEVSWISTTQSAYQVQMLLNNEVVYDSGAVYSGQNSHFINDYSDDTRAYTIRVRIYDSLGSVSDWSSTGYQQPPIQDVEFDISQNDFGGANISITNNDAFSSYYLKRNGILVGRFAGDSYTDKYAVGLTNYSVVGITAEDQSDIQTKGFRVEYPNASIITLNGIQYSVNKRVDNAFEVQTSNEADFTRSKFIGSSAPAHYFNKMKLKSFTVTFFDDNDAVESLLGSVVFYADNFGNGGYCFVTAYDKNDNFIKNSQGIYGNEVSLTLEVTDYDDSIEYPI